MNDPYVSVLLYIIEHGPSVDYQEAEPRAFEEDNFSVRIEDRRVHFTMKAHYATIEEAQKSVSEYICLWEFAVGLEQGPGTFKLVYQSAQIKDGTGASQPVLQVTLGRLTASVRVGIPYPVPPPPGLKITPDVQTMYDRFLGYRSGREPLPGLAYFCLTMLEKLAGVLRERNRDTRRQKVADKYGIDQAVLNKIGQLSSEKGGSEARKASGIGRELTPSEACFLKKAVPVLIRRAAEVAHDPNKSRDTIMLSELCLEAAQHQK